jgi:hypothetical protein
MILTEYFNYRDELLEQSKDEEGFIQESLLLSEVLPFMVDAKLIDSEDFNNSYFKSSVEKMKINAYCVNESGERLQLFLIDESSIDLSAKKNELQISTKSHYDNQFKRGTKFIDKGIKGHLNDEIQDADPARALISQISSSTGADQFDVFEIFLISATATVSLQGAKPQSKSIDFDDEEITITYQKNREQKKKNLLIKKRLIDLNFLYNVQLSQGRREPLKIDFEKDFGKCIEVIKAADEVNFETYLCVLPATLLANLYKNHSTRLLEKNIRSFLQYNQVNKSIRETIRKEPERFIAYNNGLTITATASDIYMESGKIFIRSLLDFQIVNGGQTTATIYFTQKDGFDISKVNLMAKINVAKEISDEALDDLITKISEYSNSQTKVSLVDLRSRSPQLNKIKSLSESILTPKGLKWYFEKSRGEFDTILRLKGKTRKEKEKEYPKFRKFTKEELGKYYCAWGDRPYMIKKGGEKVFRYFIEEINKEIKGNKCVDINRNFYEELISKILLFRTMEKLHGQGKYSIGQLRSAVVPYSISVLYNFTSNRSDRRIFDLRKLWISEGLENELANYLTELMKLMNNLIKIYSGSDDYGEYSKKEELWERISNSLEIQSFIESQNSKKILNKYTITIEELAKRNLKSSKNVQVDFKDLSDNIYLNSNGAVFYSRISELFNENMSKSDCSKLESIISSIIHVEDINQKHIEFEKELIHKIMTLNPELFDEITFEPNTLLTQTLDFIIQSYNSSIENQNDIALSFNKIQEIASAKGIKYASVYDQIGQSLSLGIAPTAKQINDASYYFKDRNSDSKPAGTSKPIINVSIDLVQLNKMVEWDSKFKILTNNERQYIADFAYGFKKINSFHENNVRRHLQRLIVAGYKTD